MGRVYSIFGDTPADPTAARHMLRALAAVERGFKVKRFWLSSRDVAGATVVAVALNRVTDTGTGTAATVTPHNQSDAGWAGDADYNLSVAPTVSAVVHRWLWNIQVPFEIVFADGEELVVPGATNEGFSIELEDDPNAVVEAGAIIEEIE